MSGKSLFGNLIHTVGANLHLYPSSLLRHKCDVQGLVTVRLRVVEPVAQTVGMRLVYLAYCHIYAEALVDFVLPLFGREDDAHSEYVVYLFEGDMLVLHLVPDGVGAFYPFLQSVFDTHLVESLLDGLRELVEKFVT